MSTDLEAFVAHARERGLDHATIRMLLLSAGWKDKDVARAFTEQALDLPVPVPPDTGGAREAFLHLMVFAALYAWLVAVIVLLFGYVDWYFPDPANQAAPQAVVLSGLRLSVAVILVAFPAFLAFTRVTLREIGRVPEKARSGIRRWLTYLTLVVAAIALGGDLVSLIFRLLEGELTLRFLLKVAIVFGAAGGVFAYYLLSVGEPGGATRRPWVHRRFGVAASALVAATVLWGLVLGGSPGASRLRRLDDKRIDDFRTIRGEIGDLCTKAGPNAAPSLDRPLPESLDQLAREARARRPDVRDPATGEPYAYQVLGGSRYRLCAVFDGVRDEPFEPRWNHPAGRHCFDLDALERR